MPNYGTKEKSFRLFANLDTDQILQSQIDQYKLEEFKAQNIERQRKLPNFNLQFALSEA